MNFRSAEASPITRTLLNPGPPSGAQNSRMKRKDDRAKRRPPISDTEPRDESLSEEDEYELMYEWAELLIAPPPFLGD